MQKQLILLLIGAVMLSCWSQPASAFLGAAPTGGLAIWSYLVGAGGAIVGGTGINGGGTGNRVGVGVGGIVIGVVDPAPGTILNGQCVIRYPSDILSVVGIGWFGPFSADPSLPVPPVTPGPFLDFGNVTYDVTQPSNSALDVSVTDVDGVLTIQFDAPDGIASPPYDFNMLAIQYQNISNQELVLSPAVLPELAGPDVETANMYMPLAQQSVTCVPYTSQNGQPIGCSANAPPSGYLVQTTPEPGTESITLVGFGIFATALYRWRKK